MGNTLAVLSTRVKPIARYQQYEYLMGETMKKCTAILAGKLPAAAFGSNNHKAVYRSIADHANEKHQYQVWISNKTIAEETGLSLATVKRMLADLIAGGWITRVARFKGKMQRSSITTLIINKLETALAALKALKATVSGWLTMSQDPAHCEPQNVKQESKRPFPLSRKDEKFRSTRSIPLPESLTDTSWANGMIQK